MSCIKHKTDVTCILEERKGDKHFEKQFQEVVKEGYILRTSHERVITSLGSGGSTGITIHYFHKWIRDK